MAKQLLEDLTLLYSVAPETAVNTPYDATAEFAAGLFMSFMPPIPRPDKLKSPEIGGGNEFGQKGRNGYWPPLDLPIRGWLNTEFAAVLAARCFGGTITNTPVVGSAGAHDHTVALQTKAQGRIPKLTSILPLLGGYDFLHASMAVEALDISFGGNAPPEWAATLRNTGYSHQRAQDLDPLIVPPSPGTYHYVHPASVKVTFNDGSLVDLAADARLISGRCGLANNITVQGLPGDPFRVTGDRSSGAYARVIQRGKRTAAPQIKCYMDEDLAEFVTSRDNTDITALKFLFVGDDIGVTVADFEFEITYPLATLMVDSDTEGDSAALTLSFDVDRSDASGGIASLRVRNNVATLV